MPWRRLAGFSWIIDGGTIAQEGFLARLREHYTTSGSIPILLVRLSCLHHYVSFFHGEHMHFWFETMMSRWRWQRIKIETSRIEGWCRKRNQVYDEVRRALKAPILIAYEALRAQPRALGSVLTALGVPLPHDTRSALRKLHAGPLSSYVENIDEIRRANISREDYKPDCDGSERVCILPTRRRQRNRKRR